MLTSIGTQNNLESWWCCHKAST